MRLILRGELLSGREAEQLGIAQWALPEPAVEGYGRQLAGELASLSAPAVAAAKRCVTAADASDGYKAELDSTRALMGMPETGERLAAFFSRGSQRT
jgi:enoyl-CoA hydratase/carnithine racemase